MLREWHPREPVYCIYPHVYRDIARRFLSGFPGRVLYTVKANDDPAVIRLVHQAGVSHFDCASLPEIERVRRICPGARRPGSHRGQIGPCRREEPGTGLQDTLETSMCANQLFPTVDCPAHRYPIPPGHADRPAHELDSEGEAGVLSL